MCRGAKTDFRQARTICLTVWPLKWLLGLYFMDLENRGRITIWPVPAPLIVDTDLTMDCTKFELKLAIG